MRRLLVIFVATMLALTTVLPAAPAVLAQQPSNYRYSIKATRFLCVRETPGWGSDEPYWIFNATTGGVVTANSRSRVFSDVDSGETHNFAANEGWLLGDGGGIPLPANSLIGTHIQLWEHDHGDPAQVQQAVAAAFASAVPILIQHGAPEWLATVTPAIQSVLSWLLGFLNDDFIGRQTNVFTQGSIDQQVDAALASSGNNYFDLQLRFNEASNADYLLTLRFTRIGNPTPGPQVSITASPSTVALGGTLSGTWSAPAGRPATDWVGLFRVGSPDAQSSISWWQYTGGATSGSFAVSLTPNILSLYPGGVYPGQYEFRYYLADGFTRAATSNRVTVIDPNPDPDPCGHQSTSRPVCP